MPITAQELVAAAKQQITEIDVAAAQARLSGSLLLDVREPAEFAAGHLPGAVNIPRGVLEFQIGGHPPFKANRMRALSCTARAVAARRWQPRS
ncbi:rhodanese-like domain-containing protein [Methylomonas koyamae]|uniref:rhodanese-like domain-containing protein n=1 Tax=Methylomonas koyamae TaxID=702114 RepID=UPI000A4589C8|nr:rhodanese-like domain-containing protein [Methylomonas koyamae]